jgi:type IV pilus assembly protein PilM
MRGFSKAKSVVGLDIGSSAVKAVELRPSGKGAWHVAAIASEPVPQDSIVDGAIIDGAAVAESIRRLFNHKGFRTKDVAASVSGSAVIVKKISLPVMTEQELAASIQWEAEQYIPFDTQDVNLDFQIVDPGTGVDGTGAMDVLLVAAKKDRIADQPRVITQAGRPTVVPDVDAFALQNAFEANYGMGTEVVVLLNAGASAININIVSGGQSLFTRDVSLGGNAYTEAIQRELSLSFDAAERAKRGIPVEAHTFDDVRPVLPAVPENVLLEIQKTFDFFHATAASDRIDRIVVSGGGSRGDGVLGGPAGRLGVAVERLDPFRQIAFDGPVNDGTMDLAATAGVAVGLALRKAGDR